MRQRSKTASLALLGLSVLACTPEDPSRIPARLRIGVLPDEGGVALEVRYMPLATYLTEQLEIATELFIPEDYSHLVQAFGKGEIDLAFFGGLTFLQAETAHGAVPLVLRDIDLHFQTSFLIRADLKVQRLEDCAGLRFVFGSEQSTSGHLMPRYFMTERGIDVESFSFPESTRHSTPWKKNHTLPQLEAA